ncbi:TRAP transporter small permease subunit, partial [bacterium]|nr:TRAP transporter small permease subunit [bacterium]
MQKYIEERFVMVLLAIQVLLIGLGVLSRYGFGWSFSFTEELTRYLLIWLACLGFPVCWARSEMIRFKMPWKKPAWLETSLSWFSRILIALY